jgi:isopenicillin N synthase-like dioxygenase
LVVNFGEVFTMLSHQQVPATYHRVVCPGTNQSAGSERVSTAFFYEPAPDYTFAIPEWSRFASVGAKEKVTFGEFIMSAIAVLHEQ